MIRTKLLFYVFIIIFTVILEYTLPSYIKAQGEGICSVAPAAASIQLGFHVSLGSI